MRFLFSVEGDLQLAATPAVIDLSIEEYKPDGRPFFDAKGRPPELQGGRPAKSRSAKAIRARARKHMQITEEELRILYKPIEEWDFEELARGRPRAKDGSWNGAKPHWITRAMHEQIVKRFETIVRSEMAGHTVHALEVVSNLLKDTSTDLRGKPLVPPSTKLEAAKFLIEHVVGKPKQRVESDISVKLQGMLGTVMVNPSMNNNGGFELAQGYIEAEVVEDSEDDRSGE